MRIPSVVSHLVLALLCLVLGLLIGRSQSDERPLVHGEEAGEQLVAILQTPEPDVRIDALSTFFAQLHPSNRDLVHEIYERRVYDVDATAKVLFAAWWARFDPAGALEGRVGMRWGGDDPWTGTVFREWTRRDPETALEAFLMLPSHPAPRKLEAARSVIQGWFDHPDTDPSELLVIFSQLSEVRPRGELVIVWIQRMLETRGTDYSIEYAESIPEEPEDALRVKRELMARLAGMIVTSDRDKAVAYAERNKESEAGSKIPYYMVTRWAAFEGPEAISWAMPLRSAISHKVVERGWRAFYRNHPAEARAWIETQPFTLELEPAFTLYAIGVARDDYRKARQLAEKIETPRRRLQVRKAVARAWFVDDPVGAEAWMAEVELPEEVVQSVRKLEPGNEAGRLEAAEG